MPVKLLKTSVLALAMIGAFGSTNLSSIGSSTAHAMGSSLPVDCGCSCSCEVSTKQK